MGRQSRPRYGLLKSMASCMSTPWRTLGRSNGYAAHPRIRLAPCTMRGTVTGPWVEAEATIVDATTAAHGHALLRHKYGWMKGMGDLFSRLLHRERVVIAIRLLSVTDVL